MYAIHIQSMYALPTLWFVKAMNSLRVCAFQSNQNPNYQRFQFKFFLVILVNFVKLKKNN